MTVWIEEIGLADMGSIVNLLRHANVVARWLWRQKRTIEAVLGSGWVRLGLARSDGD